MQAKCDRAVLLEARILTTKRLQKDPSRLSGLWIRGADIVGQFRLRIQGAMRHFVHL